MEACKLHLSVLDLSNNSLSGLPPEIGKISKFHTIGFYFFLELMLTRILFYACCYTIYQIYWFKLLQVILFWASDSNLHLHHVLGTMTTLRKLLLTGNPLRTLRRYTGKIPSVAHCL